jgi:aminoglycoside phosphotransferase (APT) family kinase protein
MRDKPLVWRVRAVNGAEGFPIDTIAIGIADAAMIAADQDILARLGRPLAPLLGAGGEAQVYALGADRIVRLMHVGASLADAEARAALLREIATHARHLPFRTPAVESVTEMDGRILAIEARLPGEPVSHVLAGHEGAAREKLLADYLDTASAISTISVERPFFGPLIGGQDLRAATWNGFLQARLRESLAACPEDLRAALASAAATPLPEPARPALVHLDYFPANVLAQDSRVTAVLDFGPSAVIGDARMEAWSAVAYLDAELSPAATDADRAQAMAWLAQHDLLTDYGPAKRWLAAYWSFARDDAALMAWCRRILLADRS